MRIHEGLGRGAYLNTVRPILSQKRIYLFSLNGALKHFCELSGEKFGDSIDDYC